MISLFIDDIEVDMELEQSLSISLLISSITSIDTSSTGYTKTITLPMTMKNRAVLGDVDQINAITMFNQASHTGRIEVDGYLVIDGQVMLNSMTRTQSGGQYEIVIVGASKLWVTNASADMINEIDIPFSQTISASMIEDSWTWDEPVRMMPVMRDDDFAEVESNYAYVPIRIFSCRDYHPFLHAATLLRSIMSSSGYTIKSSFIDSDYFNSLYISGAYPKRDVDSLKEKMDFLAGLFQSKTSTANIIGRVLTSPAVSVNSIGNIVDTADPLEVSDDGLSVNGVFTANNCFYNDGGFVVFVPTQEVTVAFELDLHYLTEYYMLSRDELQGFNQVYLDFFQDHTYMLTNRFVDRKDSLYSGYSYMLIVFDYSDGDSYRLCCSEQDSSGVSSQLTYVTFSSRTTIVTIDTNNDIVGSVLYKQNSSGDYVECDEDWAMYASSVGERGTVEVDVCLRSQSEVISPSNPKKFSSIYFGGAQAGMSFTLLSTTTLKPIFSPHPGLGSDIEFADVAQHEYRQIVFINGLKHLFDLCFYTDSQNKEVYIEPRKDFFDHDVIVDWSQKIDLDKGYEISEFGSDLNEQITLSYMDGDGVVAHWNEDCREKYGEYSAVIYNLFAQSGELNYQNPFFCPSMDASGVFNDALAANFIQVGDRDEDDDDEDLNFPAKVVRYMGMIDLPENQIWGWPSYDYSYPCLGFHSSLHDIGSLCFEDRDDMQGLHEYYDDTIDIYNNSKRVVVYLNLKPKDIEPLIVINSLKRDFRALYRLEIGGESALFYLEQICDYNPLSGDSTKCIFIKKV